MPEDLQLWYHVKTMYSIDVDFNIKVLKDSPGFKI